MSRNVSLASLGPDAVRQVAQQLGEQERKRSKYGAEKTVLDGIKFASRKEARRYAALLLAQRAGLIRGLRHQVRYPIAVLGQSICVYVADFVYFDETGEVVEDVKSEATATSVYKLKKRLMKACMGIEIRET